MPRAGGGGLQMRNILIVAGPGSWNGYLNSLMAAEGFAVRVIRTPITLWQQIDAFRPDAVLIDLGAQPGRAWHLFRQLKAAAADLPVLVYQAGSAGAAEDVQRAVAEVLQAMDTGLQVGLIERRYRAPAARTTA